MDQKLQQVKIKPSIYNLYPVYELNELPCEPAFKTTKNPFSPKSILNNSNQSITLEFADIDNGKAHIPPRSLHFDLYCKLHTGKWIKLDTFNLNTMRNPIQFADHKIYVSSTWELASERNEFNKLKTKPYQSIYSGVFEYHLNPWLTQPKYMLQHKAKRCLAAIMLLKDSCISIYEYLLTELLVYPTLKVKNKLLRISFTHGNKEKSEISDATIKAIYDILHTKIDAINEHSDDNVKITIKMVKNDIILERNNNQIKIYKGGDGFIGVLYNNSQTVFWVQLTDYVFGIRLWRLNDKAMRIKSICTTILNYFIFHSNR